MLTFRRFSDGDTPILVEESTLTAVAVSQVVSEVADSAVAVRVHGAAAGKVSRADRSSSREIVSDAALWEINVIVARRAHQTLVDSLDGVEVHLLASRIPGDINTLIGGGVEVDVLAQAAAVSVGNVLARVFAGNALVVLVQLTARRLSALDGNAILAAGLEEKSECATSLVGEVVGGRETGSERRGGCELFSCWSSALKKSVLVEVEEIAHAKRLRKRVEVLTAGTLGLVVEISLWTTNKGIYVGLIETALVVALLARIISVYLRAIEGIQSEGHRLARTSFGVPVVALEAAFRFGNVVGVIEVAKKTLSIVRRGVKCVSRAVEVVFSEAFD